MHTYTRVIGEVILFGTGSGDERLRLNEASSFLRRKLRSRAIRASGQIVPRRGMRAADSCETDLEISLHDWQHWCANLRNFDRLLESMQTGSEFRLMLWSNDWLMGVQAAYELLNRYQRLLPLRESPSALPCRRAVLDAHRLVHASYDPVEQRLYACALDAWNWLLRLKPSASTGLQLATLFRHLPMPAARSALRSLDLPPRDLRHMGLLLDRDGGAAEAERTLLEEVDALSFFGVDSWRYLEQHGPLATQLHVARLLMRMNASALCLALMTRQPPAINGMIDLALDGAPARSAQLHAQGLESLPP